jgi:uncharacterized membrane protein YkvA (DUF1232 family)
LVKRSDPALEYNSGDTNDPRSFVKDLRQRARSLKRETLTLYLAARHPETPWYAKLLVGGIVAYALSPVDLIPDFVPILGYLDDVILLPLGISLAIRMIPPPVLNECRVRAEEAMLNGKQRSRVAAAVIIIIWVAVAAFCIGLAYQTFVS